MRAQEWAEGGDLNERIQQRRRKAGSGGFPEQQVLKWTAQVADALNWCHQELRLLQLELCGDEVTYS